MAVPTVYTSNNVGQYIAIGSQTAFGTPAATYQFARWLDGSGLEHDRVVTIEREGGDGQDNNLAYVEHHFAGAKLVEYARPDALLRRLAFVLGQSSVVATSPVFQHEIIPLSDPRPITYEQYAPHQAIGERIYDSIISELVITHELGKPLMMESTIVGGGVPEQRVIGSARTASFDAEPPFLFHQGSLQVTIAGAAAADDSITGWKWAFTRTVDEEIQGVGMGRQAIAPLNRDVTLQITRRFIDPAAHAAINYGGGSQGVSTHATGAAKFSYAYGNQANATGRYFELEMPLAVITGITRNVFEQDGQTVYETVNLTAVKGATHIMRAMAKNAVATHVASGAL